mgnify:CR=1 FL=1
MKQTSSRSSHSGLRQKVNVLLVGALAGLSVALLVSGCQSLSGTTSPSNQEGIGAGDHEIAISSKSGVQLWAEHCGRCHNVRDPSTLSDSQWDVAMLHMRTRANLTASDAAAIREFILSAN